MIEGTRPRYTISERRICWPEPKEPCLNGFCRTCASQSWRPLSTIEAYAREVGGLYAVAYLYGLANEFFATPTRASREDLAAYAATVPVLALKEMATGMPGGTHGKGRAEVQTWVLRFQRDALDESFRLTTRGSWVREEITGGAE